MLSGIKRFNASAATAIKFDFSGSCNDDHFRYNAVPTTRYCGVHGAGKTRRPSALLPTIGLHFSRSRRLPRAGVLVQTSSAINENIIVYRSLRTGTVCASVDFGLFSSTVPNTRKAIF